MERDQITGRLAAAKEAGDRAREAQHRLSVERQLHAAGVDETTSGAVGFSRVPIDRRMHSAWVPGGYITREETEPGDTEAP